MSVFSPAVVGIRSAQTFGELLVDDDAVEIRDTSWDWTAVGASSMNLGAIFSVSVYVTTAYSHALDVALSFRLNSVNHAFALVTGAISDSVVQTGAFFGPYPGGNATGSVAGYNVYNVPLLGYYPSGTGFFVGIRSTGGSASPSAGTATLQVHKWI